MRVSHQYVVVAFSLILMGCFESDDPVPAGGEPDAAVGDPDAAIVDPPDAGPPAPDANPALPDAGTPDAPLPPPPVSFSNDLVPILKARCGGCHLKVTGGAGGLSLGTQAEVAYSAMVGMPTVNLDVDCATLKLVDPTKADPNQSSLYLKLAGDVCGTRMPKGTNPTPLPAEQLSLFARWIAEGAQNN